MRNSAALVSSLVVVTLLGGGGLVTAIAATAIAGTAGAAGIKGQPGALAAASRERKPPPPEPMSAEAGAELLAAVQTLSAEVAEQSKLIGQLKRRLEETSRETSGRLMAICLGTMTAVPGPDWGLPIGKADKAGILAACTQSERWNATYFSTGEGAPDVFVPFR